MGPALRAEQARRPRAPQHTPRQLLSATGSVIARDDLGPQPSSEFDKAANSCLQQAHPASSTTPSPQSAERAGGQRDQSPAPTLNESDRHEDCKMREGQAPRCRSTWFVLAHVGVLCSTWVSESAGLRGRSSEPPTRRGSKAWSERLTMIMPVARRARRRAAA
jgi:hypothetical protein